MDDSLKEVAVKVEEAIEEVKEKVEEAVAVEEVQEKIEELKVVIEEAKESVTEIASVKEIEAKIVEVVAEVKEVVKEAKEQVEEVVDVSVIEEKIEEIKAVIEEDKVSEETPDETTTAADTSDSVEDAPSSIDPIVEEVFTVALNDGEISTEILIAALGSEEAADALINSLKNNWSLTLKMNPLLKSDKSFGERLTELMIARVDCATLILERIDQPLYSALTHAMVLSPEVTGKHVGEIFNRHAIDILVVPSD